MFQGIIIVLKRTSCVIRRINVDTLDLASELLLQRFQGKEVVAKDETIVEKVVVGDAVWGVVRLLRIFQQDARLQLGPVFFANPGEFELLSFAHVVILLALVASPQSPPA